MFYQIAVQNRWFEEANETPFESAFYADFENFAFMVALKNSIL